MKVAVKVNLFCFFLIISGNAFIPRKMLEEKLRQHQVRDKHFMIMTFY